MKQQKENRPKKNSPPANSTAHNDIIDRLKNIPWWGWSTGAVKTALIDQA